MGHKPDEWAAAPLVDAERVLELSSTGAAVRTKGGRAQVRAEVTAIPLQRGALDGAAVSLLLPRLPDVDGAFAELRRVLRPGATLVMLVPSMSPRTPAELRMAGLLGSVHRSWTNRSGLDRAGWLLAAADFAVLSDDRRSFTLPLPDADAARTLAAELPVAGFWPSQVADDLPKRLAARAARGRVLPVPLRRLVARR